MHSTYKRFPPLIFQLGFPKIMTYSFAATYFSFYPVRFILGDVGKSKFIHFTLVSVIIVIITYLLLCLSIKIGLKNYEAYG